MIDFLLQIYYDNTTQSNNFVTKPPPVGFTHIFTPNDFQVTNSEALGQMSLGYLRLFEQVRNNTKSDILSQFPKPRPIPRDIFKLTRYENPYDWVLMSQAKTGNCPKL